tara:strand:+ start:489 stop:704 length:216 start_codon:yes stop_codon:yes gene_type:complete
MEEKRYLKVEGYSFLVRDSQTNAIVNQDKKGYESYKNLKRQKVKDKERIERLENDVSEIKDLLIQLINKDK